MINVFDKLNKRKIWINYKYRVGYCFKLLDDLFIMLHNKEFNMQIKSQSIQNVCSKQGLYNHNPSTTHTSYLYICLW